MRGVALDPSRQGFDVVGAGLTDPLVPARSQAPRVPGAVLREVRAPPKITFGRQRSFFARTFA